MAGDCYFSRLGYTNEFATNADRVAVMRPSYQRFAALCDEHKVNKLYAFDSAVPGQFEAVNDYRKLGTTYLLTQDRQIIAFRNLIIHTYIISTILLFRRL